MDPLYWPQPAWVQIQLWYLEVPGLLMTTLQFCLVQFYKEIQYLLQNKMSTCDMCSAWSCFNSRESGFAVTNENKITPKRTNILRMYLLNCCFGLIRMMILTFMSLLSVESPICGGTRMIIEIKHLILIYVGQHHELIFIINCSYICFTYFIWIITWTIDRGRARGPAGFDAPFNMGSAKGEIEWNSIFQGKYLTDYIK